MNIPIPSPKYAEVQALLQLLHNQYMIALENDDLRGIIETSGNLCSTYTALDNKPLADRWAREHLVSLCKQYINKE